MPSNKTATGMIATEGMGRKNSITASNRLCAKRKYPRTVPRITALEAANK